MQTRLHFEDLPENELPQWQQKIADAENICLSNNYGLRLVVRD
jgi:hypothetical protein